LYLHMAEISITDAPTSKKPVSSAQEPGEPEVQTVSDEAKPEPDLAGGDQPEVDLVVLQETLEYIRPAIQMDGGDLVLLGVDDGTVNLQMVGACGGCPMSMMTLKAGIERILMDRVPGVVAVNAS
jgi:Fe-S cluster biogenesis protein NfuA